MNNWTIYCYMLLWFSALSSWHKFLVYYIRDTIAAHATKISKASCSLSPTTSSSRLKCFLNSAILLKISSSFIFSSSSSSLSSGTTLTFFAKIYHIRYWSCVQIQYTHVIPLCVWHTRVCFSFAKWPFFSLWNSSRPITAATIYYRRWPLFTVVKKVLSSAHIRTC